MKIRIEHNGHEVDEQFEEQIQTKVGKLEHHYNHIIDAIVYLHEERLIKQVEIKLSVKDEILFVKESSDTFLNALEDSVKAMDARLKKYKERALKNI